jgi:asparagine synthase (glutamine-hydrolysing)
MDSFNLRMVSDVPVGMFLSGGVDSSIVTALLQQTSSKPLNTFTIGFENKKFNEAQHAKKIAKHIGTNHTELYCDENDFKNIIPLIPDMYDEPFGDSSAIPTFLVSKLAREKVKVSLSADGGDEIFGGYTRYFLTNKYYTKLNNTPFFLRNFVRNALGTISIDTIRKLNNFITGNKLNNLDARIPKLVEVLKSNSEIDFLYSATKNLSEKELLKLSENKEIESIFERDLPFFSNRKLTAYGLLDIESYLEGDIMAKVDRATMKVALEGREPFLDHKIIEFAFGLPDKMKFRDGETKWILRRILYNYVPKELIDRPKMGFGIPLDNWLNTYLKDDLQLISSDSYFCEKFRLRQHEVKKIINLYLNGKYNNPTTIWFLYILHKWYLRWF